MAVFMTAQQVKAANARWYLDRLETREQVEYCEHAARQLFAQQIKDENGHLITYTEWLECVAEEEYRNQDRHRSQYCAEMEGLT